MFSSQLHRLCSSLHQTWIGSLAKCWQRTPLIQFQMVLPELVFSNSFMNTGSICCGFSVYHLTYDNDRNMHNMRGIMFCWAALICCAWTEYWQKIAFYTIYIKSVALICLDFFFYQHNPSLKSCYRVTTYSNLTTHTFFCPYTVPKSNWSQRLTEISGRGQIGLKGQPNVGVIEEVNPGLPDTDIIKFVGDLNVTPACR